MKQYFAEYGEDAWIDTHLVLPAQGVYVDVGAADPVKSSNTAFLRSRGWTGLAVDGNPHWADLWPTSVGATVPHSRDANSDCDFVCAVLADIPTMVTFEIREPESWWRCKLGRGGWRMANTLEALLGQRGIGKIDFLSIDVEGAEYDVLKTLDWAQHRPDVVVAEYATLNDAGGVDEDFRVRDALVGMGYEVVHQTVANLVYHLAVGPQSRIRGTEEHNEK